MVEDALPSLLNGDSAAHDRLVRQAILSLAPRVDVIVLAQASIARVMPVLTQDFLGIRVLSSPHLALHQVARVLRK